MNQIQMTLLLPILIKELTNMAKNIKNEINNNNT